VGAVVFSTWMIFLDNYSYLTIDFRQSSQRTGTTKVLPEEIKRREEQIKQLKNPEQMKKIRSRKVLHEKKTARIFTS
jgi:hypothetical protein